MSYTLKRLKISWGYISLHPGISYTIFTFGLQQFFSPPSLSQIILWGDATAVEQQTFTVVLKLGQDKQKLNKVIDKEEIWKHFSSDIFEKFAKIELLHNIRSFPSIPLHGQTRRCVLDPSCPQFHQGNARVWGEFWWYCCEAPGVQSSHHPGAWDWEVQSKFPTQALID